MPETGNVAKAAPGQKADEGTPIGSDFDITKVPEDVAGQELKEDFFGELERAIEPGILLTPDEKVEEARQATSEEADNKAKSPAEAKTPSDAKGEAASDDENLQQRYSDSSKEARRLNEENKRLSERLDQLDDFVPILDAMRQDQGLVDHVKGYFKAGGEAPKSITEEVGVSEGFVMDPDEAVSNPESESGKVMTALVDRIVAKRMTGLAQRQQQVSQNERIAQEEAKFQEDHSLTDDEMTAFKDWAKRTPLTLEDLFVLKNRESRDQKISEGASQKVAAQMKKTQERGKSMAAAASAKIPEKTPDRQLIEYLESFEQEDNLIQFDE